MYWSLSSQLNKKNTAITYENTHVTASVWK